MYQGCFLSLILLFPTLPLFSQGLVTPGFTSPSSVCVQVPVTVQNTTVGGTNYFWSFCAADFNTVPEAVNLGNPNGVLSTPVFGSYVQDADLNFYGLVTCYAEGHLIRLRFGNSLLNTPTAEDLGDFGGIIPEQVEGLQLEQVKGNWTAVIVGGGNQATNSSPRVAKVDFGNAMTNAPTATNWGNVGGLNLPHGFFITNEGGGYYGFTINVNDNTITRLSFGPDFTTQPTGVNLGNIGNIDYPAGISFIHYNQNWYAYIANRVTNSITRLDFGASLVNIPTGVNIGDPGNTLAYPRDLTLFISCEGIYGFVVNETSNELVELNFGTDPTNVNPQATDLGNIGNLSFPHSISNFFRVGNDLYAFIPNVNSNSLTRIRFVGCSNIPGTSAQNPAAVSYPSPGVYNINLLVDIGLPTQTSFCRQITVNPLPTGMFIGDTVCSGTSPVLQFNTTAGFAPFSIQYSDGSNGYAQNNLNGASAITLPYSLTNPGSTTFTLNSITDANGCSSSIDSSTNLLIKPLPQGGISGNQACGGASSRLLFTAGSGIPPFTLTFANGTERVTSGGYLTLPPILSPTTFTLLSIEDSTGCTRTSGFSAQAVTVPVLPTPAVEFAQPAPVCQNGAPLSISGGQETSGLAGSGTYAGPGINPQGIFTPSDTGEHTLVYTFTASDGCMDSASTTILVNPVPLVQVPRTLVVCGGNPVTIDATGGEPGWTFTWSPTLGLSNADILDPVADVDTTTTFVLQVNDLNGCTSRDTTVVNASVNKGTKFLIPGAFTPNGDGHNDCFGIQRWDLVTLEELDIFNRWGEIVFTTRDPSVCWDGTYNGRPQPVGAYAYVIKGASACGKVTRTGMVMLMR